MANIKLTEQEAGVNLPSDDSSVDSSHGWAIGFDYTQDIEFSQDTNELILQLTLSQTFGNGPVPDSLDEEFSMTLRFDLNQEFEEALMKTIGEDYMVNGFDDLDGLKFCDVVTDECLLGESYNADTLQVFKGSAFEKTFRELHHKIKNQRVSDEVTKAGAQEKVAMTSAPAKKPGRLRR